MVAFSDKHASEEFGRKLEKLGAYRASGVTPDTDLTRWIESLNSSVMTKLLGWGLVDSRQAASNKMLTEHIEDWEASLKESGSTSKHANQQSNRVRRLCEGCSARVWTDFTMDSVRHWLAKGIETNQFGKATANHYLSALKTFAGWMEKNGRATSNPFKHLQKRNAKIDVRVRRRALSIDEQRRLLDAAREGESYRGISGEERVLVYRVALETGLRWSEIRSLKVRNFDLNWNRPTVTVEAAYSKHRREDILPLRGDTAEVLREHLRGRLPQAPAFSISHDRGADMLRIDLEQAGVPYEDESGRVCDFHALRHTFVTSLAQSNVHPKTAQALARHSTIALTMDRYTHTVLETQKEAVEALESLNEGADESLKATGTHGVSGANSLGAPLVATGTTEGYHTRQRETLTEKKKTVRNARHMGKTHGLLGNKNSSGAGTRTPDTRIMIPLL